MHYVVTNQFLESRIIRAGADMAPHEFVVFSGTAHECRQFLTTTF